MKIVIKLSVIIPVYNVEEYLDKCIKSVLNQTFSGELEVILVNDGSTDKSPMICDKYALIDKRIKVIHKKNGGLSSARNAGIDVATGNYIAFLDSDDFWIKNTINNFVEIAEKTSADILVGNAVRYIHKESRYTSYPNNIKNEVKIKSTRNKLLYILKPQNRFQWHVWKCIYKADLIKNNKLYFKEGLLFEDVEWLPRVLTCANSIEIVDKIFIAYRYQRPNSITVDPSKTIRRLMDMIRVVNSLSIYFKDMPIDKELKKRFYINFSEIYIYVFLRQVLIKDICSKRLLKKLSYYINYYQGKYSKILKIMIKILGYKNTCMLVNKVGLICLFIRSKKGGYLPVS